MIEVVVNFDPGEVLACCGLFEVAEVLHKGLRARFDLEKNLFQVEGPATLQECLDFVKNEDLKPVTEEEDPPFSLGNLVLSWWWDPTLKTRVKELKGTEFASAREVREMQNFKTWRKKKANKIFDEIRKSLPLRANPDIFRHRIGVGKAVEIGRFSFDTHSTWGDDFPYSLDAVEHLIETSPAIEIFAFIGLQNFRPKKISDKIWECYLWTCYFPIQVARAAFAGVIRFGIAWDRPLRFTFVPRGSYRGLSTVQ